MEASSSSSSFGLKRLRDNLEETLRTVVHNFFHKEAQREETPCSSLEHTGCPSLKFWSNSSEAKTYSLMCSRKKCSWVIPLAGNAYKTAPILPPTEEEERTNFISACGIANWDDSDVKLSTFFHSTTPGYVLLALRLRVPNTGSTSRIRATVTHAKNPYPPGKYVEEQDNFITTNDVDDDEEEDAVIVKRNYGRQSPPQELFVTGSKWQLVPCGKFFLPMDGYIQLELEGVSRTGPYYADITHLVIVPESDFFIEQTFIKFVADPADFYWGRRGPSVHLRYITPPIEFEYFYTEVTVPTDQDVIGAYFAAAGFRGGYFGIQVNSETERRILFSVWSAYTTDNPEEIPEDYKVVLLKKGEGVIDGEFGDEGSGGQSYLVYPWVADTKYRFLVFATKDGVEDTVYTAWFNSTEDDNAWQLIASWFKPKDSTYLSGLYAFSENFIPTQGHLERRCLFGNQWIADRASNWIEVTEAEFTADATANSQNRMDISGGVDEETGSFFLRNCGFFSDAVAANTDFERPALGLPPQIDFGALP